MTDPATTTNNNKQQSLEALCFGGAHVTALTSRHLTVVARGTFGEVSLAFWSAAESTAADQPQSQQRRQVVAVKTIAQAWTRLGALAPAVQAEITALRCLAGEATIVSLRAVVVGANSGNSISLVLDYAPVDLGEVLEAKRRSGAPLLSAPVVASLTGDLLQALAHTHARGIVHRDVKPGNLLVCARTGRLQLCDFGLAYFVATDNNNNNNNNNEPARTASTATALGTLYYRPPEVLLGVRAVRASVDVYAAGLVLAELLTGRPLWAGTNDLSQLQLIFGGLGTPTKESWPTVGDLPDWSKVRFVAQACPSWTTLVPRAANLPWATPLMARLVQLDPGQRSTAAQAGQLLSSSRPSSDAWDGVVRECIPLALLPPLCLSDDAPHGTSQVDWPVERLVATAQARRTFLSTLEAQQPQHSW